MPRAIYLAEIRITPSIERKIREKHSVTAAEVRQALVLRPDVLARWENHEVHGLRVIALGTTYWGRLILAALYPVDPPGGVWNLMTARSPKVRGA
jgi:hypothetical protein